MSSADPKPSSAAAFRTSFDPNPNWSPHGWSRAGWQEERAAEGLRRPARVQRGRKDREPAPSTRRGDGRRRHSLPGDPRRRRQPGRHPRDRAGARGADAHPDDAARGQSGAGRHDSRRSGRRLESRGQPGRHHHHGFGRHARSGAHPPHDPNDLGGTRRRHRLPVPGGIPDRGGAVPPTRHEHRGVLALPHGLPDSGGPGLYLWLSCVPRPGPKRRHNPIRGSILRSGRLPVHGGHPSQAQPDAPHLRRGAVHPALRLQRRWQQDERGQDRARYAGPDVESDGLEDEPGGGRSLRAGVLRDRLSELFPAEPSAKAPFLPAAGRGRRRARSRPEDSRHWMRLWGLPLGPESGVAAFRHRREPVRDGSSCRHGPWRDLRPRGRQRHSFFRSLRHHHFVRRNRAHPVARGRRLGRSFPPRAGGALHLRRAGLRWRHGTGHPAPRQGRDARAQAIEGLLAGVGAGAFRSARMVRNLSLSSARPRIRAPSDETLAPLHPGDRRGRATPAAMRAGHPAAPAASKNRRKPCAPGRSARTIEGASGPSWPSASSRDEGEFGYIAQEMLRGVPMYVSAYTQKLPGTYLFYALFLSVFGESITAIHLGLLLVNAAIMALIFLILRKTHSGMAGCLGALVFGVMALSPNVLGFAAHATFLVSLFALLGLYALLHAREKGLAALYLVSGICFGFAFLRKQSGIFFAPLAVVFL